MNPKSFTFSLILSILALSSQAHSQIANTETFQTIKVFVLNHDIESQGVGEQIGTVQFADSEDGLVIKTAIGFLTTGEHGFHVHENPSCEFKNVDDHLVPGLSAGGHYDPEHAGKHLGPNGMGHLGDLPKVIAPRLNLKMIQGRSIIIHEAGDNYSDTPNKLGGGGARVACGVIE